MGSEVLLDILDSVQIKEEPLETVFCEDPPAVDLSPLVKVEISDNPLILKEEDAWSHGDPAPGTETIGNAIASPSFYQLQSLFPCKEVSLHPPAASLEIQSVRSSPLLLLPSSSSSYSSSQKRTAEEDYDKFRKLKKVKLERQRRVALKELFEDLDYWVALGLDERSRR